MLVVAIVTCQPMRVSGEEDFYKKGRRGGGGSGFAPVATS